MTGWSRRIRRWWWQRRHGSPGQRGLREFVYLDDTSVYSLLASRGPVAATFTATETLSAATESTDKLGVRAGGIRAEAAERSSTTRTVGSEIVRHTSAQARFTQLLRQEDDEILVRATPRRRRPRAPPESRLLKLADDERHSDWVVDVARLRRGELVEIDVVLGAEALYRVSETVTSITGIVKEVPAAFGLTDESGLRQAGLLAKVLDGLLAQLIPVRGAATDLRFVRLEGRELLVRRELVESLPLLESATVASVDLVAFSDRSLYWKDVRRVLFSGARYTVLARLAEDGVLDEWSPVVLADVVRAISSELADSLDSAGDGLLDAMREQQAGTSSTVTVGEARLRYLDRLAPDAKVDERALTTLLDAPEPMPEDVEAQRRALEPVRELLVQGGLTVDDTAAAAARSDLSLMLEAPPRPPLRDVRADSRAETATVQGEIVAIYW